MICLKAQRNVTQRHGGAVFNYKKVQNCKALVDVFVFRIIVVR